MKIQFITLVFLILSGSILAQTQTDTIYVNYTSGEVIIDGAATETCWLNADWHPISQVWIPYNAAMQEGDFAGRFKTAWDSDYLYVLVEITDDLLSDDHSNPLQNWWDDDCLELFIDEDRSKGNHERNANAFAYHVSLSYDAIDMNSSGQGVNYKNNLTVKMDTIGDHLYLWELAVKMYSKNFSLSNPEASRVKLSPDKLMGFTIAYCDNDQTTSRENFIGSMYMAQSVANNNYITADYFGSMLLVDKNKEWVSSRSIPVSVPVSIFPNPVYDQLVISESYSSDEFLVEIFTVQGKCIYHSKHFGSLVSIQTGNIDNGPYLVRLLFDDGVQFNKLILKE